MLKKNTFLDWWLPTRAIIKDFADFAVENQ